MTAAAAAGPGAAVRVLVVWCPDWPVVATGEPLDRPVAVLRANRVVACSPVARTEGVAVHQRGRDAQARCPDLLVVEDDPDRAAHAFEPVPQALETLTPRLEVVHPGCCVLPTRGPSRYHGGDLALARRAAALVAEVLAGKDPRAEVRVGVADGVFAATLAARGAGVGQAVEVVPPGESAAFLAPLPLRELEAATTSELVGVLRRLGLRTLGDLAALPVAKVVGRFGAEGLVAHRLAGGRDARPPATTAPPPDLRVEAELDPPVDRVEAAAFVARGLADDLYRRLARRGSACTRLLVGAETEHGERHERMWRTEGMSYDGGGGAAAAKGGRAGSGGGFRPPAIVDRLRWQLEGWLQSGVARPTGGVSRLWLEPDEVVPAGGRQLSFNQGSIDAVEAAERAGRAVARVQGLVGMEAVLVPEWRGGRGPGERVSPVALGTSDLSECRPAARPEWVSEPWPGSVPEPSPAVVHPEPLPAEVLDEAGRPVRVSGRGELSADPASLQGQRVVAWAGPWPCDEHWWDPRRHRRRARLQVTAEDGVPYLLVLEANRWAVEARYD